MIEFGKPKYGWLNITIINDGTPNESVSIPASYLTDVPADLLTSAIASLKEGIPFCIEIDAEGKGRYVILNAPYLNTLTLLNSVDRFDVDSIDTIELAEQIEKFVEENLDDVYNWDLVLEDEDEEINNYKRMIDSKLEELKVLIKESKNKRLNQ